MKVNFEKEKTTFRDIKASVHHVFKDSIIKDMLEVIKPMLKKPGKMKVLMGENKGRKGFIEEYLYLTLFKFYKDKGYDYLWETVKTEKNGRIVYGFIPESKSTFRKNVQRTTHFLRRWSQNYIYNRPLEDLKEASELSGKSKKFKKVLLLIDSFDKKICNDGSNPSEDENFSGKIMHRARRYHGIQDFSGFCNFLSDGYSPKVYDAHWVEVRSDIISQKYSGLEFLADGHYTSLKNSFGEDVIFHTPYRDDQRKNSGSGLTKGEEKWNKKISQSRGRVEQLHSIVEKKFCCLKTPFQDSIKIQENLIHIATAARNYEILYLK